MKALWSGVTVFLFCLSTQAAAVSWKFSKNEDRFEQETTYTAKIAYDQVIEFTDMIGVNITEFMSFGLRCDVKNKVVENILVRFSFEKPLAYYGSKIRFMIDANDQVFRFDGQMFSNSMSSGFASIKYHEKRDELVEALAKGRHVSFKVDPDGKGENREEALTLKGSSKAIAQWKRECL